MGLRNITGPSNFDDNKVLHLCRLDKGRILNNLRNDVTSMSSLALHAFYMGRRKYSCCSNPMVAFGAVTAAPTIYRLGAAA
jgi:hypothetical protein